MTPELLPMLRPFALAVDAQRKRAPMTAEAAERLEGAAKLRAWWIAGLTKDSLISEAHRLASSAIADGLTKSDFLEQLGTVLDQQEGLLLTPQRLELIARNNHAVSYAAGRLAQMRDPDVTRQRPYWQYPLGPSDARTSAICKKLEGFVARHDDPVWDHIYPPNHHGERHLQVLTLTEEQAQKAGIYTAPEGDAGADGLPWVDGQKMLPDPGWDFAPDLLGADDAALETEAVLGDVIGGVKTAADYGLAAISDIDLGSLPEMPPPSPVGWDDFARVFGSTDGEETWYPTPFGSVRINHWFHDKLGDERAWLATAIKATLDDPFEVWTLVDRDGRTEMRLLRIFRESDAAKPVYVVVKRYPMGWLSWTAYRNSDPLNLEVKRTGRLVLSKAGRKR